MAGSIYEANLKKIVFNLFKHRKGMQPNFYDSNSDFLKKLAEKLVSLAPAQFKTEFENALVLWHDYKTHQEKILETAELVAKGFTSFNLGGLMRSEIVEVFKLRQQGVEPKKIAGQISGSREKQGKKKVSADRILDVLNNSELRSLVSPDSIPSRTVWKPKPVAGKPKQVPLKDETKLMRDPWLQKRPIRVTYRDGMPLRRRKHRKAAVYSAQKSDGIYVFGRKMPFPSSDKIKPGVRHTKPK